MSDMPTSLQAARKIALLHSDHPDEDDPYISGYEKAITDFMGPVMPALNAFRQDLGLPVVTLAELDNERRSTEITRLSLYAFPVELIPPDPTWPANVHIVNALSDDYIPPGWDPLKTCPQIVEYLAKGEKPFVVTFGFMQVPGRVVGPA